MGPGRWFNRKFDSALSFRSSFRLRGIADVRVNFDDLPWESSLPGARSKSFSRDGKKLRIAEFTSEFVEPHWCEKGHVGIVLNGELEIDFKGAITRYPEGAAIFIPAGAKHGHKARAVTPVARLFLVEEA